MESLDQFLARPRGLVIDGAERPAATGRRFEVLNPATGEPLAEVAEAGSADVDAAIAAARAAQPGWSALPPGRRADLLWALGARIEELAGEFARLEALDNGKPIGESLAVDIPLCSGLFKYYAGWTTKIEWRDHHPRQRRRVPRLHQARASRRGRRDHPVELPAADVRLQAGSGPGRGQHRRAQARRADPAVRAAAGPGHRGGRVPARRGQRATRVRARRPGAPLAAHPDVDKVTFTGETSTGQKIMDAAKGNMKRLSLELGGKSPSLVFADADLDAAVEGTFGAVYFNQGQCCIAGARVYVQDTGATTSSWPGGRQAASHGAARRSGLDAADHDGAAGQRRAARPGAVADRIGPGRGRAPSLAAAPGRPTRP